MRLFAGTLVMLVLALFGTSHAAGTPSSSFIPRTSHEPHASLNDRRRPHQGGHSAGGHGSSHKTGHHVKHQIPSSN
jgi:hypothetical protein